MSELVWKPAPYLGMNERDPFYSLGEGFCLSLYNMIAGDYSAKIRPGFERRNTGMTSSVESLYVLHTQTGTEKLIATANSRIWNCTSTGAASNITGALTISSRTNGFEFNQRLILMDGTNPVVTVNSTPTAAAAGYTGPGGADSTLICGFAHKELPHFIEVDSMSDWFSTTVGAITGALTEFDLSSIAEFGGFLYAGTTFQVNPGTGSEAENLAVYVTSQGEMFFYSGDHPDADNWFLVGKAVVPKPPYNNNIRRCFYKYGSDTLYACEVGLLSVRQIFQNPDADPSQYAITRNLGAGTVYDCVEHKSERRLYVFGAGLPDVGCMYIPNNAWSFFYPNSGGTWTAYSVQIFGDQLVVGGQGGRIIIMKEESDSDAWIDDNIDDGTAGTEIADWDITYGWENFGTPKISQITAVETFSRFDDASYNAEVELYQNFKSTGQAENPFTAQAFEDGATIGQIRHDVGAVAHWHQLQLKQAGAATDFMEIYGVNIEVEIGGNI